MIETVYSNSERIKAVEFSHPYSLCNLELDLGGRERQARSQFQTPLVQLRFILERSRETELLGTNSYLNGVIGSEMDSRVAGRIPFRSNARDLAIYYVQSEHISRESYLFDNSSHDISHQTAIQQGFKPLKTGGQTDFSVEVADYRCSRLVGDPKREPTLSMNQAIEQLINLHQGAFDTAHDISQRTIDGIAGILQENPVVFAIQDRNIVAACYLERDDRFTFDNISLVEPTYFTDTRKQSNGISSALRQRVRTLVDGGDLDEYYRSNGTIIFNESIRPTSFVICLRNNYSLAGNIHESITGDLGDSYAVIGPANGKNGYIPMGLTYYTNLR